MEDKQQWLSMAAVVLVIAGLGFFLYRQSRQSEESITPSPDVQAEEKASEILKQMNVELPENAERATLKDVTNSGGAGVASRVKENEQMLYSLLVGLPEPENGSFYEGYLVMSESGTDGDFKYLGRLQEVKGGWRLEVEDEIGSEEYRRVVITREKINDRTPEEVVLEGSF